jgi:hypothetical protein
MSPQSVQKMAFVFNYRGLLTNSINEDENTHDITFTFQDCSFVMKYLKKQRANAQNIKSYSVLSDPNKVKFALKPTPFTIETSKSPFVLEMIVQQSAIDELKNAVVTDLF